MARSSHAPVVLLAALLLAVAGSLSLAPNAQAIEVVSTSPISGEEVVDVGTDVTATFDVPAVGVDGGTFTLAGPAGSVSAAVSGSDASWTLDPNADLQPGTTYTAALGSGITDTTGAPLAAVSWSFTTDTPPPEDTTDPTVTDRSPRSGATGVGADTDVTATFSEEVEGVGTSTFTLRAGTGSAVPASVDRVGATDRWILDPDATLREDTRYTVSLDGGSAAIRDLAGNLLADTSWSFTTERTRPDDTTRPRVVDRSPEDGATDVFVGRIVTVTFSEEVEGVDETTFRLVRSSTGDEVSAVVFRRSGSDRWSLSPDDDLREDTRYTVELEGGTDAIRDLAGNALTSTDWSFRTTGRGGDDTRPRVVDRSPGDGATRVNRRTDVLVTFSEVVARVNTRTFTLRNSRTDSKVDADVFRDGSRRWVLDPDARLARHTRYVARLTGGSSGIRDTSGNRLPTTRWSFRTRR